MIQVKFYHSSYFSISSLSVYIISFLFFESNFHRIEDGRMKDLIYEGAHVCDIVNRRMKKKKEY